MLITRYAEIIMPNFLKSSFLVLLLSQVLLSCTPSAPQPPDNLKRMATIAADHIRSAQHEKGFWLTAYTPHATFTNNTKKQADLVLPAIVIDILSPYATETNLGHELQHAREYLADQIEENGLVRYFGRPDQSHIGKWGCVISPDSDDTALVWRIAINPDTSLLSKTLEQLKSFQNEAGFYHTWLSTENAYQCIRPGNDPNPVDVGIQIHLIQFFSRFDMPEEKDKLCKLVKNNIGNPKLWVYYTPLLPVLRESDLSHLGCHVRVPLSVTSKIPDHQKQWLRLTYFARDYAIGTPPEENIVKQTLAELAAGDFALIEQNPPLLYHNDKSSTPSRYYWSKTFGMALWLRVYWDYISTAHMENNRK